MESIVTMGMKPDRDRQRGRSLEGNRPEEADRSEYGTAGKASAGPAAGANGSALPAYLRTGGAVVPGKEPAASGRGTAGGKDVPAKAGRSKEQEQALYEERLRLEEEEKRTLRTRRKQYGLIAKYVVATVLVSYILLRLTDNAGKILVLAGNGIRMVGMLLMPLFWGFILSYILSPVVTYFEKRLRRVPYFRDRRKGRRAPAVAITCVLTLIAIGLVLSVVASAVTHSLKVASVEDLVVVVQSFAGTLGSFQQTLMARLNALNISSAEVTNALKEIGQRIASFTSGISSSLTGAVGHVGGFLTGTVFAIIFAVYFLLDGKGLTRYWNRVLLAVGGKKVRRHFHILARDADAVFSGYVRGQLIDAFIMAVLVSMALSVIGVRYAVIIGVLSGIGNLIPYLGPVVAYGSTILVCLLSGDLRRLLVALVVLFLIQTVDGNVINPRLLSSSIDVHPMLVIAALIIGGSAGGLVGMLFAVPVAAFLKIQFDKVIASLLQARMPAGSDGMKRKRKHRKKKPEKPSAGAGSPDPGAEHRGEEPAGPAVAETVTKAGTGTRSGSRRRRRKTR